MSETAGPRRTVLLVDDDDNMRTILRKFMPQVGELRVLEAGDGMQAVDVLLRETVDLVILDLNMPRMNGLEVTAFMRRNPTTKTTPIVMFTTEKDSHTRRKALRLGCNRYLNKPFDPRVFRQLMREMLAA